MNRVEQATGIILGLSYEELDEVVTAIKYRRQRINKLAKNSFKIGQHVWFDDKGERVEGRVKKINRKYIKVDVGNYTTWRVVPSLLNATEGGV